MPSLKEPQREAFALAIARGGEVAKTYAEVYPGHGIKNPDALRAKASRFHAVPAVKNRIAEIKAQFATKTSITAQRVLEEMAKIGFANLGDFLTIGPDGKSTVDLSKIPREQMAAVSELQIDTDADGKQRVKVKLHDKRAALLDIGKHLGMFKDKLEVSGPNGGPIATVNTVEVSLLAKEERQMLKEMLLAIAERKSQKEFETRTIEHEE
jgi:phage terminase small subunit